MKTKLTLSIDKEVVEKAKKYADMANQSISEIVERYLKTVTEKGDTTSGISERVKSLAGKFNLPEGKDDKEILIGALAKKYE